MGLEVSLAPRFTAKPQFVYTELIKCPFFPILTFWEIFVASTTLFAKMTKYSRFVDLPKNSL